MGDRAKGGRERERLLVREREEEREDGVREGGREIKRKKMQLSGQCI